MSIYVDSVLLDVGAAVDALPTFSAEKPDELAANKA